MCLTIIVYLDVVVAGLSEQDNQNTLEKSVKAIGTCRHAFEQVGVQLMLSSLKGLVLKDRPKKEVTMYHQPTRM